MKKGIFLLIAPFLFALNLTYTKAFFLYQKGFKNLNSNPNMSQKYFEQSFNLLKSLENQNIKSSQTYYLLGTMYLNGWGVQVNYEKAKKEFQKAIKLGNIQAKCQMAKLYIKIGKLEEAKKYKTPQCENLFKENQ